MADLNTKVAYPYTRSNRPKDKIMSEAMISEYVRNSLPFGETTCWVDDDKTKLIINGYYFEPSIDLSQYPDKFAYCFIEKETENNLFPELLNWASMTDTIDPDIDGLECLFILDSEILQDNIPAPFDQILSYDESGFYYGDHIYVDICGGRVGEIDTLSSLYVPFYIALASDPNKTNKIWIKQDTMNPYVYDKDNLEWIPLGAVYKVSP